LSSKKGLEREGRNCLARYYLVFTGNARIFPGFAGIFIASVLEPEGVARFQLYRELFTCYLEKEEAQGNHPSSGFVFRLVALMSDIRFIANDQSQRVIENSLTSVYELFATELGVARPATVNQFASPNEMLEV
jgi:hypothetical protein